VGQDFSSKKRCRRRPAKYVVFTLSLDALQKIIASVLFQLELPRSKRDAMRSLDFGVVNKLWLAFARAFWDNDGVGVSIITSTGRRSPPPFATMAIGRAVFIVLASAVL
jgi:monoamine oxidase